MPQFPAVIDPATLNGTTGVRISGTAASDRAGYSVSTAGDINGDGFADLIVGAIGADANGSNSGASYVVFGTDAGFASNIDLSSLNGSNGFRLSGGAANDESGVSVAAAGDVNGDGYADVIIGAHEADPNGSNSGASYVVFGKATGFASNVNLSSLDGSTGFKLSGVAANDLSGHSVASAGDVNGDGFDDLIVGAYQSDAGGGESGASYVVFGKASGFAPNINLSSLDGTNVARLTGSTNDRSGWSVASAGDINGDGVDDVIVGARSASPNGILTGAAFVVFGNDSGFAPNLDLAGLNGSNGFALFSTVVGDRNGWSVASAGDVNGDGFDDLIVGAVGVNGSEGAGYVVFGTDAGFASTINLSNLDGTNGFKISGETERDRAGWSVASAGDVNGDGFDDVILGAPYTGADDHYSYYLYDGASYVVFGKAGGFATNIDVSSLDGSNGFKIEGALDFDGGSVSSAGDLNGDGFDDLIVGAASDSQNGIYSGSSYVIFGRAPTEAVVRTGTDASQTLAGGDFDDTLTGLGGDDRLFGNGGTDTMAGGEGNDTYYVDSAADVVSEAPGQGTDTVHTTASFALGHNVEHLIAESDADLVLRGNGRDNVITGGGGADRLVGQAGDDTLTGGAGRDVLLGGGGSDTFVFQALSDSTLGAGRDVIKDFVAGTDKIDLAAIDANSGLASDQAFSFIGSAAFSNTAGELQAKALGGNTLVSGDVDGNGVADFHILLGGNVALQATDFLL